MKGSALGFGVGTRNVRPSSDNTLRSRMNIRDEGIVQPASKEVDQLSRRLHQCPLWLYGQRGSLSARICPRCDREEFRFQRSSDFGRVLTVTRRRRDISLQYQTRPLALVRAQIRIQLLEERQRLPVRYRVNRRCRVMSRRDSLGSDFPSADAFENESQQRQFSIGDADNELSLLMDMPAAQTDGPLTIYETGDVSGVDRGET